MTLITYLETQRDVAQENATACHISITGCKNLSVQSGFYSKPAVISFSENTDRTSQPAFRTSSVILPNYKYSVNMAYNTIQMELRRND